MIARAPEGDIFLAGVILAALFAIALSITRDWSAQVFRTLLLMTSTHLLAGRAAGMSSGYAGELPRWAVIFASMVIETFMVLLFYPLFVFSYKKLFVFKPLADAMTRARRAAIVHHKQIVRYGIPGLLLFVWFPFWMTGPMAGCVIGFLMGLRNSVNLTVVLSGTYLAIICWGLLLEKIHERLKTLGSYVPAIFVGLLILLAVYIHVRYVLSKKKDAGAGKD